MTIQFGAVAHVVKSKAPVIKNRIDKTEAYLSGHNTLLEMPATTALLNNYVNKNFPKTLVICPRPNERLVMSEEDSVSFNTQYEAIRGAKTNPVTLHKRLEGLYQEFAAKAPAIIDLDA